MNINQGEIWLVNFEPSIGNEIRKTRPALVINSDTIGRFGIKLVVPITEWKEYYNDFPWIIKLEVNNHNKLSKTSSIECFQVKSFSEERFERKIGDISNELLYKVHTNIIKVLNPTYKLK